MLDIRQVKIMSCVRFFTRTIIGSHRIGLIECALLIGSLCECPMTIILNLQSADCASVNLLSTELRNHFSELRAVLIDIDFGGLKIAPIIRVADNQSADIRHSLYISWFSTPQKQHDSDHIILLWQLPEPVPPPRLWTNWKPCIQSQLSYSLLTTSMTWSTNSAPSV